MHSVPCFCCWQWSTHYMNPYNLFSTEALKMLFFGNIFVCQTHNYVHSVLWLMSTLKWNCPWCLLGNKCLTRLQCSDGHPITARLEMSFCAAGRTQEPQDLSILTTSAKCYYCSTYIGHIYSCIVDVDSLLHMQYESYTHSVLTPAHGIYLFLVLYSTIYALLTIIDNTIVTVAHSSLYTLYTQKIHACVYICIHWRNVMHPFL